MTKRTVKARRGKKMRGGTSAVLAGVQQREKANADVISKLEKKQILKQDIASLITFLGEKNQKIDEIIKQGTATNNQPIVDEANELKKRIDNRLTTLQNFNNEKITIISNTDLNETTKSVETWKKLITPKLEEYETSIKVLEGKLKSSPSTPSSSTPPPSLPSEIKYTCTRTSGGRRRKSKKRSKKSKAKTRRH